ncbi:balbiani ring protein 3 isoform X2 [Patella vulgata]|uniref:balbiani ring protein 3 isoform X2 n=1 Tax=Patella vulgata TaxID=6465 RepID=UPI0024A7CD19|nr:balbiani ring protein 3 isoform X2 [Patella vulgata]
MWLGFIGVLAVAQSLQISLEVCPQPSRRVGLCPVRPEQTGCVTNSQCRPGYLCCLEGCGRQCKPDLAVRTAARSGLCPIPLRRDSISCPNAVSDKCDSDTDCTGTLKCCFHPCGRTCTNINSRTLLLKSGTCPMPSTVYCNLPRRDHCLSDADCPRLSKCCAHACGRSCVQVVPSRTRVRAQSQTNKFCPPPSGRLGICVFGPNSCTTDIDCGTGKICCSEGCGKECKTPLSNAQLCPVPPELAATSCLVPITDSCQTNSNCTDEQLCCKHPCGKRCQAPVGSGGDPSIFPPIEPVIKPGSCPVPASGFLIKCALNDQCLGDSVCPGTQKCCKSACGKRCKDIVKTKSGTCPASNTKPACDQLGDNCYKDGDCSGTQKCCKTSCGNRCLAPAATAIIIRPGVCRVLPPGVVVRCALTPDTCSQDGDCPGVQKCCTGPCSKSCEDTVKPKAGTCPTQPLGLAVRCAAGSRDECSQDNHCSGSKKCCKGPCSKYCADPGPAVIRPGTCPPPPNPALVLCAFPITNKCSGDSDCDDDKKCCPHPCGKYCDLDKPKPGNCPKLPASAFLVKCLPIDRCKNDRDCPFTQKCCRQGCGNRCVAAETADPPEPTKPGVCRTIRSKFRCRSRRDRCKNDSQCGGSRKCCQFPCGKRCRRPLRRTKRGQCPPKPTPTPIYCLIYQNDCETDDNCPDSKKCCATPCGIGCVSPNFYRG